MGLVQLNGITKKYGSHPVLNGINLTIDTGEIYGLVGINGAGKTTLLNIIAGILEVDSGSCLFNSRQIGHGFIETGMIGYLPDIPGFYEYMKVREYIEFLEAAIPTYRRSQIAKGLLATSQIDPDVKISTLSRGNRQKLGIIASVMGSPKLLLLDEPTSALDPVGRRDALNLIDRLRNEGIAIVLSSHILTDMELICDRIGYLHNGIISKEVDMRSVDKKDLYYEISLPDEEVVSFLGYLQTHLPGFETEIVKNCIYIKEYQHREHLSSEKLFTVLAHCGTEILKLEKKKRCDLNQIMEEVLKE